MISGKWHLVWEFLQVLLMQLTWKMWKPLSSLKQRYDTFFNFEVTRTDICYFKILTACLDWVTNKSFNQSCWHRSHYRIVSQTWKRNCCRGQYFLNLILPKASWARSWFGLLFANQIYEWPHWCCNGWNNHELWRSL